MRKKCSSDCEKLLKFDAEGEEFAKFLRSLEQFIKKGQFFVTEGFLTWRFPIPHKLEQLTSVSKKTWTNHSSDTLL